MRSGACHNIQQYWRKGSEQQNRGCEGSVGKFRLQFLWDGERNPVYHSTDVNTTSETLSHIFYLILSNVLFQIDTHPCFVLRKGFVNNHSPFGWLRSTLMFTAGRGQLMTKPITYLFYTRPLFSTFLFFAAFLKPSPSLSFVHPSFSLCFDIFGYVFLCACLGLYSLHTCPTAKYKDDDDDDDD